MPQNLEPVARVSERWSPGRAAKVELRDFTPELTEDPMTDDRMALSELLQKSGARFVDLEPVFRADGGIDLYALDFHIYRRAHRRLYETLRAPIAELLGR